MKVVITGATGNVGTSLLELLAGEPRVDTIVGIARRCPEATFDKARFVAADIAFDDLEPHLCDADAVVHLAWTLQPSHEQARMHRVNVDGSARLFRAAIAAGVRTIIHASSVGAYGSAYDEQGDDQTDGPVAEDWPIRGIPTSTYSRHKCLVEHLLDQLEEQHPEIRVVRMRPALTFKATAGTELKRYFLGRLARVIPNTLFDTRRIPVVPDIPNLRFQAVHSLDVAEAYATALVSDVRGAFNLAADPIVDSQLLAQTFGARTVRMSRRIARAMIATSFHMRLQPTEPGWLDMGLSLPIMNCARARGELAWQPRRSAVDAILDLLAGMRDEVGIATAPLTPIDQPV